ncbi:MAG: sigma-E processing peptidase SpoIIGA, partial [Oscillospiraceae bacterium]|nr:sigma-E processing peptidase SpoIIGA [Oscillospiraceae bacterium]
MPVIYIDILIAVNLFIDYLLLAGAARLLRQPYRRRRLVLAAFFGGMTCCIVLVPIHWLALTLYKIAAAFAVVRIAFRWEGWRVYLRQTAVFFIVSAIFAGAATAVWVFAAPAGMYMAGGVVYYNVSPLLLAGLTGISYLAVCGYERLIRRRTPEGYDYRLRIVMRGNETTLRVLYDSGNTLTEPFSGQPAAVVTLEAVKQLLPPG